MQKNSCYTKLAQHFSKANQSFESLLETALAILTNLQGKKLPPIFSTSAAAWRHFLLPL